MIYLKYYKLIFALGGAKMKKLNEKVAIVTGAGQGIGH